MARPASGKSGTRDAFQVHLDAAELGVAQQVGTLYRDASVAAMPAVFEYDSNWLSHPSRFMLDPRLDLYKGDQYPQHGTGGFGIFMDSAPDRWGRMLMERREAADADREQRPMRNLHEIDFLLGVHDTARMGAFRFRATADGPFLAARDDHLRNHGFLRTTTGWNLAPAFDMNPNPYKAEHALTLDGSVATPSLAAVRQTAELYRLTVKESQEIESQVQASVHQWKKAALHLDLPRAEILMMSNVIQG